MDAEIFMKKFKVFYPRTLNWYSSRWYELSTWCNETIGHASKWNYIDSHFVFYAEEDEIAFRLRWL